MQEGCLLSKVTVFAGICGFTSIIKVQGTDDYKAKVKISSPCEMIKKMGAELTELDWTRSVTREMCDSLVYKTADKYITHTACPVPSAILKAVEVEFGLALPKDVSMKIER